MIQWFDERQFERYRAPGENIGTGAAGTISGYVLNVLEPQPKVQEPIYLVARLASQKAIPINER